MCPDRSTIISPYCYIVYCFDAIYQFSTYNIVETIMILRKLDAPGLGIFVNIELMLA